MIYVYCSRASDGARGLTTEINKLGYWASRYRRGIIPLALGDLLINWGEAYPSTIPPGVKVLNKTIESNKLRELQKLKERNVACPEFTTDSNAVGMAWIKRRANHQGGSDLLNPPLRPDYWVKKYDFVNEFRVHIVRMWEGPTSVRAGIKVPRTTGFTSTPHPWIKSYDAGWMLDYGSRCQTALKQKTRDAAKAALDALGLDFAAIDIGVLADGTPIVLEANRAPGNEGNTTKIYAQKFISLANREQEELDEEEDDEE